MSTAPITPAPITAAATAVAAFAVVTLDTPIKRGAETIGTVQVRKPQSGELRGLSLSALLNLDYSALETLLPRITIPTLGKHEVAALDPSDLTQFGTEVMDFLLPKAKKEGLSPAM